MTLRELKKEAQALIGKSDFAAVFDLLSRQLNPECDVFSELVQQSSRYNRVLNDDHTGVVSRENALLEYNQISKALLHLLERLREQDLGQGGVLEDPLDAMVRQLTVEVPVTPLYRVNCDRRKPLRSFWQAFDEKIGQKFRFQFYFLPCDPAQQPEGFADRIVHELLEKELQDETGTLDFPRKAQREERLHVEPLPLGRNAESSKQAFKKYFSGRFGLDKSATPFEDYLRSGLPALPWKYVVTAFKMTDEEWDDSVLGPYLQWMMATFSQTGPDVPTFLFFFVVSVKNAHRGERLGEAAREAMDGIRSLVEGRTRGDATLIEPLPPVPATDLETWMEKLGDNSTDQKEEVVQALAARLKGEEEAHYRQCREFNMERIEDFQERVYHAHKHT